METRDQIVKDLGVLEDNFEEFLESVEDGFITTRKDFIRQSQKIQSLIGQITVAVLKHGTLQKYGN